MAEGIKLDIKIVDKVSGDLQTQERKKIKIVKTLGGNFIISDHPEIDFLVIPADARVVVYPKKTSNSRTYAIQDKFFKFLIDSGVVSPESIIGGDTFNSIEAIAEQPIEESISAVQVLLFMIAKFIENETPSFMGYSWEELVKDRYTNPSEEESTELDSIPLPDQKRNSVANFTAYMYNSIGSRF